jgi:integrase
MTAPPRRGETLAPSPAALAPTTVRRRTKGEIRSVYLHLPVADSATRPYRVCFAVGVFAGLRTGEVLALDWQRDVDLGRRRIHVQWQVKEGDLAPVKDNDSRVVPILDSLLPILSEWRLITGGSGLLFPPIRGRGGRPGNPPMFRKPHALHKHFNAALVEAGVTPRLTWYQGTRHTFSSHWVMDGGTLEMLREILGHSSVKVTERYAHLIPEMYTEVDRSRVQVDLSAALGQKGGREARGALTRALSAIDNVRREAALHGLENLGTPGPSTRSRVPSKTVRPFPRRAPSWRAREVGER